MATLPANPNAQVWPKTGHQETDQALLLAFNALKDHSQAFESLAAQKTAQDETIATLTARIAALEAKP